MADSISVFLYGTLLHPPLLRQVLGRAVTPAADSLPGWTVTWARDQGFPLIAADPGGRAKGGLLTDLTAKDLERLNFYEAGFGYDLIAVTLASGRRARVYVPRAGLWQPGAPWSLADWQAQWGSLTVEAAGDYMALWPAIPPEQAAPLYGQMLVRAASRLRAMAEPAPVAVRQGHGVPQVVEHRQPYVNFFSLVEQDLKIPRFDGTHSPPVRRAGFVSGDAVTLLPYDPVRDRVMVVEQFRFGPWLRRDPCPWSLEPIAGRIDPGETPESAARREAVEEAHLTVGDLIPVARYYPSPGAMTEYLYSYIALADLPDGIDGIGGLADENEDIRSHILSFDALMALVKTGEAENGPLILTALALARMREALRAG